MPPLSPTTAAFVADAILALHVGIVAFVVLGVPAIALGGWRGWRWVHHLPLRLLHLALICYIAIQAWLGIACPLTVWEQALRNRAGEATYGESFIQHWLSRLIFFDAPWWVFVAAYSLFALLVAACWWCVPPVRSTVRARR